MWILAVLSTENSLVPDASEDGRSSNVEAGMTGSSYVELRDVRGTGASEANRFEPVRISTDDAIVLKHTVP